MPTEKQLANLRPPWKPGERVPGAGRPRKRPISEAYDDLVRSIAPANVRTAMGLGKDATWADCIALGQARKAVRGDAVAAKEVREGIEGKATQRFEFAAGDADSRLAEFVVVYATAVPGAVEDPKIIDVAPEQPELLEDPQREQEK
jgi:hypothetical protein